MVTREINNLHPYDFGYIAGIIDGEGSFSMRKKKNPAAKKTYIRGYGWEYCVNISSTDFNLIVKLQQEIGGSIVKLKMSGNRKQAWRINWYPTILRQLLPNLKLVIKEKHRILFLMVMDIMDKRNHSKIKNKKTNRFVGTRIDDEDEQILIKINQELKKLNQRGLSASGGV